MAAPAGSRRKKWSAASDVCKRQAQDRALGLVVQLEMDPVHREVPSPFLGPTNEVATQLGPRGGGWLVHCGGDRRIRGGALHHAEVLHQVVESPTPVHVVVLEVQEQSPITDAMGQNSSRERALSRFKIVPGKKPYHRCYGDHNNSRDNALISMRCTSN